MKYSKNFVIWVNRNYQNFFKKWIELPHDGGSHVNPYTTKQPCITWDEMVKKYLEYKSREEQ